MTAEREALAEIAGVLAAHTWVYMTFQQRTVLACSCGDQLIPATSSGVAAFDDHRAHLADLLAARDRRVRAEALREAADALYAGEGPDVEAYADERYGDWLHNRAHRIEADA